jgi:predicted nucleic acid-binding protein
VDAGISQVVDTCILINLLATGQAEEILRVSAKSSVICGAVRKEAVFLRSDDPNEPLEPVNLEPFIEGGVLTVCDIEGDTEELLYVDYAAFLDDGEAMSLALALSRGFHLATDDRKARRLFTEATNDAQRLVSTCHLIRTWGESLSVPRNELSHVLGRVLNRTRYQPSITDPDYKWWIDLCGQ